MSGYTLLNEAEAQEIFDQFPGIDAAAMTERVNELFTPYLFFRKGRERIELWSSCCREHGAMDRLPRTIGMIEAGIIWGKHDDKTICPYCGRMVTLKNVSKLGKKKKLLEFHPVIFLNAKDGDLYARCYWARKNYLEDLTDPPLFMDTYAMHFAIGRSEEVHEEWMPNGKPGFVHRVLEGNYDPVHRIITEPFTNGTGWNGGIRYVPYYIFGLEAIAQSDFKYCQYEHFEYEKCDHENRPLHGDLCKYLAAYSIYPRQIEMLMKTGGKSLVRDLVVGRSKNRNIIKWAATNPCDAFGLDKTELRAFRESGCDFRMIEVYKRLRRKNMLTSFASLHGLEHELYTDQVKPFAEDCIRENIHPDRMRRYFDRFTGPRCHSGVYTLRMAWQNWKDYLTMAEQLDYDLTVETVRFPRNLDLAHSEAQAEIYLRKEREQQEKEKDLVEAAKESLERRQKKYNAEYEGYFIRIAENPEEIRAEGKDLVHCVGGYAERHMKGVTTILFLRRCEAPNVPLYTIQMDGNQMVQIHGYKNEGIHSSKGRFAPDPRKTMAWLLDPWLEWLKKGSPRRDDGTARLPKYKEVKTA